MSDAISGHLSLSILDTLNALDRNFARAIDLAVKAEREACAQLALMRDDFEDGGSAARWSDGYEIAAAIRARSAP